MTSRLPIFEARSAAKYLQWMSLGVATVMGAVLGMTLGYVVYASVPLPWYGFPRPILYPAWMWWAVSGAAIGIGFHYLRRLV